MRAGGSVRLDETRVARHGTRQLEDAGIVDFVEFGHTGVPHMLRNPGFGTGLRRPRNFT